MSLNTPSQTRHPHLPRRTFLAGVTATAAAALLAACGSASGGDTPTTATKAPVTPGATANATILPATAPQSTGGAAPAMTGAVGTSAPATMGKTFSNVALQVWVHKGSDAEVQAMNGIVAAFNSKYSGQINVTLSTIPNSGTDYQNKVTSAAAANQLPDVVDMDGPFVAAYAYGKILRPLDTYFTKDDLADFAPSIIEQGTWNGKLWAVGAFSSSIAVSVNKQLAQAAGIAIPTTVDTAWDWNTLLANAKKLTTGDVKGLDWRNGNGPGEWYTYAYSTFVWSDGGDLLAPDGSAATGYMNSPATIDALTKMQGTIKDGLANPTPDPKAFEKGKAALQFNGPQVIAGYAAFPDLQWAMMPLPYLKTKASPSGSWAWGVSTQSKNPDAAAEFLKWLVGTDSGVVPMVNANKQPPARKSAYAKLPIYADQPYVFLGEQLQKTAKARPTTPGYPVLTAKFTDAVNNVFLGGNVKALLDAAAAAVDDDIKRNNGYKL